MISSWRGFSQADDTYSPWTYKHQKNTFHSKMNDLLQIFGERVRSLRTVRGWSQERLALEADLDRSYIGGVERGERNVSLLNIAKIADAMEISVSELMRWD